MDEYQHLRNSANDSRWREAEEHSRYRQCINAYRREWFRHLQYVVREAMRSDSQSGYEYAEYFGNTLERFVPGTYSIASKEHFYDRADYHA